MDGHHPHAVTQSQFVEYVPEQFERNRWQLDALALLSFIDQLDMLGVQLRRNESSNLAA